MPYHEGEKGSKMPNMIGLVSTGLRRYIILANKPKQKGLFSELSLPAVGACEVANNPHIFLTRANQQSKKFMDTLMEP